MSYLFDYGEGLFCFVPVFLLMSAIFATLVWNNMASRTKAKAAKDKTNDVGD